MTNINPWHDIPIASRIRIDDQDRIVDCFWFTDNAKNYGFLVEIPSDDFNEDIESKLSGIDIHISSEEDHKILFMLILKNKDDWEIFLSLCNDLISATNNLSHASSFYVALKNRIKRWQTILSSTGPKHMSLSSQMGLFSELTFLKDHLIPKYGVKQSIEFWVGPESDKQDFLLDNCIFEIKSHRTTKPHRISISSPEQLISLKEPLYLVVYSLSNADSGQDLNQLICEIEKKIVEQCNESYEFFFSKIEEYGFSGHGLKSFINDKEMYFRVDSDFPKLDLSSIPEGLLEVKFSVDLNKCSSFEVKNIEDLL